jgi:octaprenyl-diphosphate synthase
VKEVIAFVRESGGIAYAQAAMQRYYEQALAMLNDFPDSPYKESLGNLVRFTIARSK